MSRSAVLDELVAEFTPKGLCIGCEKYVGPRIGKAGRPRVVCQTRECLRFYQQMYDLGRGKR
jgi:hypothetical protein